MTVIIAAIILSVCVLGFSDIISRREVLESRVEQLEWQMRENNIAQEARNRAKRFGK